MWLPIAVDLYEAFTLISFSSIPLRLPMSNRRLQPFYLRLRRKAKEVYS